MPVKGVERNNKGIPSIIREPGPNSARMALSDIIGARKINIKGRIESVSRVINCAQITTLASIHFVSKSVNIGLVVADDPTRDWLGSAAHLTPVAVIFFHPSRTFGGMIETVSTGIIYTLLYTGICVIARYTAAMQILSSNYNPLSSSPNHNEDTTSVSILLCAWLFVLLFICGYVRVLYPRLSAATSSGAIIAVFSLTSIPVLAPYIIEMTEYETIGDIPWSTKSDIAMKSSKELPWMLARPLIIGALVNLVVNVLVFPEAGGRTLQKKLGDNMEQFAGIVGRLHERFGKGMKRYLGEKNDGEEVDGDGVEDVADQVKPSGVNVKSLRADILKLQALVWESELEISYSKYSPREYGSFVDILQSLMRHVGAMEVAVNMMDAMVARSTNGKTMGRSYTLTIVDEAPADVRDSRNNIVTVGDTDLTHSDRVKVTSTYFKSIYPSLTLLCEGTSAGLRLVVENTIGHGNGSQQKLQDEESGAENPHKLTTPRASYANLDRNKQPNPDNSHKRSIHNPPTVGITGMSPALEALISSQVEFTQSHRSFFQSLPETSTSSNHQTMRSLWASAFFLSSFYAVSVRDAALDVHRLIEAIAKCDEKRRTIRRMRFWAPSVPVWELIRKPMSLTQVQLNVPDDDDTLESDKERKKVVVRKMWNGFKGLVSSFLAWFRSYEVRFAVKLSMGTLLLAWPAFVYPDMYNEYRGGWSIITLVVVISPSLGASVSFGAYRIVGTIVGAILGYVAFSLSFQNPYGLWVLMTAFSVFPWYMFFASGHARIGTTVVLTMEVVALIAWVAKFSPGGEDTIFSYAWKRCITMLIGTLTALVLTSTWWPFVAQKQLRKKLGKALGDLGVLFGHVAVMIADPGHQSAGSKRSSEEDKNEDNDKEDDEGSELGKDAMRANDAALCLEKQVTDDVPELLALLALTKTEPRLKGRFPGTEYGHLMDSMQSLLDRIISLRLLVSHGLGEVHQTIIEPISQYRKVMFGEILLYFHIVSSSLLAKSRLPPLLPTARQARLRLLSKFPATNISPDATDSDINAYVNFFAWGMLSEEIISELEDIAESLKKIVGQLESPLRFDRGIKYF
ncbi:hypothetical protein HDU76_012803 [Blyttiomyces sp. JEL0837]|nr:hypothetical protein HDU76_012803 [Blyttiomyces sp. JEL0837]